MVIIIYTKLFKNHIYIMFLNNYIFIVTIVKNKDKKTANFIFLSHTYYFIHFFYIQLF